MRGTLPSIGFTGLFVGIIPAYAGNTNCGGRVRRVRGDHPRVCGEHWSVPAPCISQRGSSPRMRGTRHEIHRFRQNRGIIPAYAGNTHPIPTTTSTPEDHPRVCGEHLPDTLTTSTPKGSSPRMRGTHCASRRLPCLAGIIPAYAGNTLVDGDGAAACLDHPRVCGEHPTAWSADWIGWGSSPRMRGTLLNNPTHRHVAGIIPAYAGNT